MSNNRINICLACDDNYSKHAGVVIASILANAVIDDELSIYILDGGISEVRKSEILSLKSIKDCEIVFIPFDEKLIDDYKKIKTLKHISYVTYYRLKLPSLLPYIDRIIYLDCDMVVLTSLQELYQTDMCGKYIAGCKDIGTKKKFTKLKNYINAGMLLFDLAKMRELDIEKSFLEYANSNIENLKYSDQDIINYASKDGICILDDKWNVQSSNFVNRSSYMKNPSVVHFIAKKKPWHWASFSYHRDLYFKYLQLTPWMLNKINYFCWTKVNWFASLLAYFFYRPTFFLRPRFYRALINTYLINVSSKESENSSNDKSSIIVCYHKDSDKFENDCLLPLHVGKANHPEILLDMTGDNTGDNISHKNSSYCELTGLYWLWKNVDADNYGLFHYRRLLDVSDKYSTQLHFSKINITDFNNSVINALMGKYDIILPKKSKFKTSLYKQYKKEHFIKDLEIIKEIIKNKYPHYLVALDRAFKIKHGYFFNMFIMKKELFKEYCSWLFDILAEAEKLIDTTEYNSYQSRVLGFLSERMFSIFIQYQKEKFPNLKIKEVNTIFINPEPIKVINFLIGKFVEYPGKVYFEILGLKISKKIRS